MQIVYILYIHINQNIYKLNKNKILNNMKWYYFCQNKKKLIYIYNNLFFQFKFVI